RCQDRAGGPDHRRRGHALWRPACRRRRLRSLPSPVPRVRRGVCRGAARTGGRVTPFTRPALIAVIGVSAVSLAVAVALTIAGDDPTGQRSAGADSTPGPPIGEQALVG